MENTNLKYKTKKIDSNRSLGIRKKPFSQQELKGIIESCKENANEVEKVYKRLQPKPNRTPVVFNIVKPSF